MTHDSFLTNLIDEEKLNKFYIKHQKLCSNYTNYIITTKGTGIGIYVTIQCEDCLKTKDISNYECW